MKWVAICLATCAIFSLVTAAVAQVNPFEDVPKDHWGYQALDNLQKIKILLGYPDGKFRGGRVITRFEFAYAIKRALEAMGAVESQKGAIGIPGPAGPQGPAGEQGPQGPAGPPGLTPKEIDDFRRLTREFRDDLAGIGVNEAAAVRKLDTMERDVQSLKLDLSKRPSIYGSTWLGLRSTDADGNFVDRDGRFTPQLGQQFPRYDFMLGIDVPIGAPDPKAVQAMREASARTQAQNNLKQIGLAIHNYQETGDPLGSYHILNTWQAQDNWNYVLGRHQLKTGGRAFFYTGDDWRLRSPVPNISTLITANNLREFYSGNFATILPLKPNPASDVYLNQFVITTPFNPIGDNGILNLGRQPIAISPLTLWKPPNDTYFNIPWYDDGNFMMDGAKIRTSFPNCAGNLDLTAFAGQFSSVRGNKGPAWNSPIAGVDNFGGFGQPLFIGGVKPAGQTPGFTGGAMTVDQLAGITLGLGIKQLQGSQINFSALDMSGRGKSGYGTPGGGFNGLFILGSDFNVNVNSQFNITGDWAKTITHTGLQTTINPRQNNAFDAGINFNSGNLNVRAGYRYIDPLFNAPGYWNKIGNWYNPTNIQGPTFRAGYDFSPTIGMTIGGDFFSAARNRAVTTTPGVGGLSMDDDIHRILVGLRWDVSKNFRTTIDWEGVYWSLSGSHTGIPGLGAGTIHPTEHYITLGTGYNLTSNTQLKLSYQIGSFNGHGLSNGAGFSSNFNTFTTQVAVKF